jgi:hypothetical protein
MQERNQLSSAYSHYQKEMLSFDGFFTQDLVSSLTIGLDSPAVTSGND